MPVTSGLENTGESAPLASGGSAPQRKKANSAQKKFAVGATLIVGAIGYLIYTGVQTSGSYYRTVSEVLAMGQASEGMGLRLEGKVVAGSIWKDVSNLKLTFSIMDKSQKAIVVYYEGVIPDMFQENMDVVVEGKLSKGRFVATKLLTSCPSRYDAAKEVKKSI